MSHRESLARSGHDRNHLQRSAHASAWGEPGTLAIVAHGNDTLVRDNALVTLGREDIPGGALEIYLGTVSAPGGTPHHRMGYVLGDAERAALDARLTREGESDAQWRGLRDVGTTLDDADVGLATELIAMGHWHESHRFSPRTGAPTEVTASGWVRKEKETGREHFPRTDAAIIVAVIHTGDDGVERVLLAHNSMWEEGRYSVLAGFVEPGETLEAAVVREVAEETGVAVRDPRYYGSQPWPFPASLMVGFFAEARSAEISVDRVEILDARWFTRDELRAAVAAGSVRIPGDISIAGHLLRSWQADGAHL